MSSNPYESYGVWWIQIRFGQSLKDNFDVETLSKLPTPARPRIVNMLLMISPFVHNFHIISLFVVFIYLLFFPCVLWWRSPCEIDMSVIKRGEGEWEKSNLLSEGTLLVGGCWNLPAMSTPTHPTQLHTCDIREDRKCTQYLTIQLNTTCSSII